MITLKHTKQVTRFNKANNDQETCYATVTEHNELQKGLNIS
jgi:hypothetical protein